MYALGVLLCVLLLLTRADASSAGGTLHIAWDERWYNPTPLADDLILPMPCGAAMVFRPVEIITAADPLDDRRLRLGRADAPERAYKEGRRLGYLRGAFSAPDDNSARRFYLAKYETTRDQFVTLQGGDCPLPDMGGRRPMTGLSWFDAVEFARRYTEWLRGNASDELPREDDQPGFLRLPTEEEWEFAARGGERVDPASFLNTVFPMAEGKSLRDYVWHQSQHSAGANVRPVGRLLPNPLGLFDILGNASELVFLPFHLDRRGRLHGQPGGFVIRGGYVLTPPEQMSAAWRQEHNYFDKYTGEAKALDYTGVRLAISAPVIVSPERLKQIRASWAAWPVLPTLAEDVDARAEAALSDLAAAAAGSSAHLRVQLEAVRSDLESAHTAMNAARLRALRALIRTGAFVGKRVKTDDVRVGIIERNIDKARAQFEEMEQKFAGKPGADDRLSALRQWLNAKTAPWEAARTGAQSSREDGLTLYSTAVIEVAEDYSPEEAYRELRVVVDRLQSLDNAYLVPYAEQFVQHIDNYSRDRTPDKRNWLKDLLAIARVPDGAMDED